MMAFSPTNSNATTITNESFNQIFGAAQSCGMTMPNDATSGQETPEPEDDEESEHLISKAARDTSAEATVDPSWEAPIPAELNAYQGTVSNKQRFTSTLNTPSPSLDQTMSTEVDTCTRVDASSSEELNDLDKALAGAHLDTIKHYENSGLTDAMKTVLASAQEGSAKNSEISYLDKTAKAVMARRSLTMPADHKQLERPLATPQKIELPPLRFTKRKRPVPVADIPQPGDVLFTTSPALHKRRKVQIKAGDRVRMYINSGLIIDKETAHKAMVLVNQWIESTLNERAGSVYCFNVVQGTLWNHELSWLSDTFLQHLDSGTTDMTLTAFPRKFRKYY
jgi:hypothetical protein